MAAGRDEGSKQQRAPGRVAQRQQEHGFIPHRTRVLVVHQSDALDGAVLLEFAAQLALGDVVRQARDEERLEGVALGGAGGRAYMCLSL